MLNIRVFDARITEHDKIFVNANFKSKNTREGFQV